MLSGVMRARLLRAIKMLRQDGLLDIRLDGVAVEDWQIDAWQRHPISPETESAPARVTLRTTTAGVKFI